jgi:hypothetical protein
MTSKTQAKPKKNTSRKKKVYKSRAKKLPLDREIILAKWQGRFGNRMHQYAYGVTYANKFNSTLVLPSEWEGSRLFSDSFYEVSKDDKLRLHLNQSNKSFDNDSYRGVFLEGYGKETGKEYLKLEPSSKPWEEVEYGWYSDLCAYQKEIFAKMSSSFLKKVFDFTNEVKNLDLYKRLEDKQGTYDIAHLRRDDISSMTYNANHGYSVLSKKSYTEAFKKYGYDPDKVEWTSDDWTGNWGVTTPRESSFFKSRGGWNYPIGSQYINDIIFEWFPDFLRLYFARSVFRANSSFSWWACFLGNQKNVYSPVLTERNIYSGKKGSGQEINMNFVKGNNPHWLILKGENCDKIVIPK